MEKYSLAAVTRGALLDPGNEKGVCHREHNRTYEDANQTEGYKPTDNARKNQ